MYATITLYKNDGSTEVYPGKMKRGENTRLSVWATSNQNHLDALIRDRFDVVRATIDNDKFNIVNGLSEAQFKL